MHNVASHLTYQIVMDRGLDAFVDDFESRLGAGDDVADDIVRSAGQSHDAALACAAKIAATVFPVSAHRAELRKHMQKIVAIVGLVTQFA